MPKKKQSKDVSKQIDDALIEKCIYGDTYSIERGAACLELSKRCAINLTEAKHPDTIRKKVIDEVSFVNHEDLIETNTFDNVKFPKIYSEPNLYDEDFNEEEYIDTLKEDKKFGKCSLALYGLEKQFIEQINKGYFQTDQNADNLTLAEQYVLRARESLRTAQQIKFSVCNIVENPKLPKDTYKVCSEANLNNEQHFFIKRKEVTAKAIKAEKYEDLIGVALSTVWALTKPEWKEKLLNIAKIIAKKELYKESFFTMHDKWYDYDKYEQEALWKAYHSFPDEDIPKMLNERVELYEWHEVSRLNCWHNFLGHVPFPEKLRNKWLEIELAVEAGEISEDKAINLIKSLAEEEKLFDIPTSYIPLRLRLYGSQKFLNSLFNDILVENPLSLEILNNNTYTYKTIANALKIEDFAQLTKDRFFTEKEKQRFIEIKSRIDADDLWDLLREASYENVYYRLEENLYEVIDTSLIYARFAKLMEMIDDELYTLVEEATFIMPENEGDQIETPEEKCEITHQIIYDYDDDNPDFEREDLENYMGFIKEKYPELDTEIAWLIMQSTDRQWAYSFNIPVIGYLDYMFIENLVQRYIDDIAIPDIKNIRKEKKVLSLKYSNLLEEKEKEVLKQKLEKLAYDEADIMVTIDEIYNALKEIANDCGHIITLEKVYDEL